MKATRASGVLSFTPDRPARPPGGARAAFARSATGVQSVERAVADAVAHGRAAGGASWAFRLRPRLKATASMTQDWLVVETDAPRQAVRRILASHGPFDLLRFNRRAGGAARLVLGGAVGERGFPVLALRASADVALGESNVPACSPEPDGGPDPASDTPDDAVMAGLSADLRSACASLVAMHASRRDLRLWSRDTRRIDAGEADDRTEPGAPAGDRSLERLADRCAELGWVCVADSATELRITLDTADMGFRQALVRPAGDGVRLLLNLFDDLVEPPSGVAADAIGLLLLRVAGLVRLVRPVASESTEEVGLEVRLARPTAERLDRALGALSVAARECAAEVEALAADARLAEAVVAMCSIEP